MPYRERIRAFTPMRAYIDESGNDEIFTLSCIYGKVSNWGFLINDWHEVIEKKNRSLREQGRKELPRFHAADCSSYIAEFKGWNEAERRPFLADLLKVLDRPANAVNSIGCSIRLNTLAEEIPETAPNPRAFGYALLLKVLLHDIKEMIIKANRGDISQIQIPLIHERCIYDAVLSRSFNDLHKEPMFPRQLFPSLTSMGWEDCPHLQPADFMAYENFKEDERHLTGRDRRYTLGRLISGDSFGSKGGCFDEEGIKRLKEWMTDDVKQQLLFEANIRTDAASTRS